MAMDGLPRPPRRVPAGADPLRPPTVIEGRTPRKQPRQVVRRAPRAWYLIPLVLAVAAAGAGLGWMLRAEESVLDTDAAKRAVGSGVVTVLATACHGTGRATGFLVGDNKVITVASAIYGPVSVVVVTADGQVRSAKVMGTGNDGVALLRIPAPPIDGQTPPRAAKTPAVGSELALIGNGNNFIGTDDVGSGTVKVTVTGPGQLRESVNAALVGSPLVNADGQIAGVLTSAGGSFVSPAGIEPYLSAAPPINSTPGGVCPEAWGPKALVTPAFDGTPSELSGAVMQTFERYVRAVNAHTFEAVRETYAGNQLARTTLESVAKQHRTTYLFGPRVSDITPYGAGGARARMQFTTIHHTDGPAASLNGGMTCARWNIIYQLEPSDGVLKISGLTSGGKTLGCDGA